MKRLIKISIVLIILMLIQIRINYCYAIDNTSILKETITASNIEELNAKIEKQLENDKTLEEFGGRVYSYQDYDSFDYINYIIVRSNNNKKTETIQKASTKNTWTVNGQKYSSDIIKATYEMQIGNYKFVCYTNEQMNYIVKDEVTLSYSDYVISIVNSLEIYNENGSMEKKFELETPADSYDASKNKLNGKLKDFLSSNNAIKQNIINSIQGKTDWVNYIIINKNEYRVNDSTGEWSYYYEFNDNITYCCTVSTKRIDGNNLTVDEDGKCSFQKYIEQENSDIPNIPDTGNYYILDPDTYTPTVDDSEAFKSRINIVIDVIRSIGIIIAVISLMAIGLKTMVGSVEEKAEFKKVLPGYIVGVILVVAITTLPTIIYNIVSSFNQ